MQVQRNLSVAKTTETDSSTRATVTTDRYQAPRFEGIQLDALLTKIKQIGNLPGKNKRLPPRAARSSDALIT